MLIDYINKALSKAEYDKLEDGTFFGKIPEYPGVLAFGKTFFECQNELRSVLEGWLIVKIRHGDLLLNFTTSSHEDWAPAQPLTAPSYKDAAAR